MSNRFAVWTPELVAELVKVLDQQVAEQLKDPELREVMDWMISCCGLEPLPEIYRLQLLTGCVIEAGGDTKLLTQLIVGKAKSGTR